MPITLNQSVLKMVMDFTKAGTNETQIRNFLINNIWPALRTKIDTKMNNNFDPGWIRKNKLNVFKLNEPDRWQIYPKFYISGTTNLTSAQLRSGISNLLRDLKTTLIAEGTTLGVTNMTFHIHYEDGRVPEADET